ncbi:hypothetical protein L7F22_066183 [Adiantum nelumboides]|nr:hypothetical protein [Adiantum nelumboides]
MTPPAAMSGLAASLNKGRIITKPELPARPSSRKGKLGSRTSSLIVRKLIRDVVGFVPYEKHITELLKVGKDKQALKVAKRRLGTHLRVKKKRERCLLLSESRDQQKLPW